MRVVLRRIATLPPLVTYYKRSIVNTLNGSRHKALMYMLLRLQRAQSKKSYTRKLVLKIRAKMLPLSSRIRRKVLPILVQLLNYREQPSTLLYTLNDSGYRTPNFYNRVTISKKTNYSYLATKLLLSTKHKFLGTSTLLVKAWDTSLTAWPTDRFVDFIKIPNILDSFLINKLRCLSIPYRILPNSVTDADKLFDLGSFVAHYFNTVDLRRDYILATANIALTYNLYHYFFTRSVINRLRKSNLPWIRNNRKARSNPLVLKLLFNFRKHYLYITLFGRRHDVFFSIGTSLFLKFVNYKKSLKKSYSLKLLLIKYLRKLLLVSNLTNFYLYVRHTSSQLNKFLQLLQKPFNHSFINPLTGEIVDESVKNRQPVWFNFQYMIFLNNKPYGFMKTKKTGRLKRKIRRKLIKLNRIAD